jgi:hypothetical protein
VKSTTQSYAATTRKYGEWWLIEVPELDIVGQAQSVSECTPVAREIIGLWLDVDPETIDVTVTIENRGARRTSPACFARGAVA